MEKDITWQAEDHYHTHKNQDWFWVLGIAAVSVSIVAILFQNFFFAILILVAAFTLALLARREPRIVHFTLTKQGLLTGPEHYPWNAIRAFWIDTTLTPPTLLIDTTKILAPHLFIPIPKNRVEEIRAFLKENVKEEELHEPATHKIIEFFGL